MSVPANIITDLTNLQAQVAAALPLESAPYATLKAIQLNAENLETEVTLELYAAAGQLDTWVAPIDPTGIIAGFQVQVGSARDEWRILDMLSVISRAVLNLDLMLGNIQLPQLRTTLIQPIS